ncbi:type II secretion system protein [Methanococcus vannielii SB]|uniref:Type II secretion system protein n=1 Tax=Methanococcus vannielii (strain ATCC 35089 / DSM 1224 / JCM 13029 / OCM 148 / SB) TaxID=406327 RepID=A6UQV7_METVS|nr:archaellar assembly protein FlaJ [Methanococcus vannielii]ABR54879.1 type II secretion system protein [Methanococcus vannielii SB]
MFFDILPRVGLKPKEYILKFILPAFIVSLLVIVLGITYFTGYTRLIVLLLPLLLMGSAIGYPYIELDSQRQKINERLHVFITKFGVLSITDLERKHLMHLLSTEKEELGQLANESHKIYVLLKRWNQSLAESCRFLANRCPSSQFGDFLDRMAYSIDSGQELKEFLSGEQDIIMEDYSEFYKRALYSLDMFKEMYVSAVTSVSFFVTFAIIAPFLMPYDFVTMVTVALLGFILIEVLLVYAIKNKLPYDRLWHTGEKPTRIDLKLKKWLTISVLGTVILTGFLIWGKFIGGIPQIMSLPYQVLFALGVTPLAISGYIAQVEENIVIRKELNFPDFLRSLGDSVCAKGGGMTESLQYLSSNDFGPLTKDLEGLYKRVSIRIDSQKAWRYFGYDTCSYLIQLFSEMFERCTYLGGNAGEASNIIGKNFRKIINLRRSKYQNVNQFAGIMYGLAGGMALTLYASSGVASMVNGLYTSLEVPDTMLGIVNTITPGDFTLISYLIYSVLVIYSVVSGYLIKLMDGGHYQVSLLHFVIMLWVASIVGYVTEIMTEGLLGSSLPI